jgi:hypothetical protein
MDKGWYARLRLWVGESEKAAPGMDFLVGREQESKIPQTGTRGAGPISLMSRSLVPEAEQVLPHAAVHSNGLHNSMVYFCKRDAGGRVYDSANHFSSALRFSHGLGQNR